MALYPNKRGIGYAVMDHQGGLKAFGLSYVQPASNHKAKERIDALIKKHNPAALVTRGFGERGQGRIHELVSWITKWAEDNDLPISHVSRQDIRAAFEPQGAYSKYQISRVLQTKFPALIPYAYPKRKRWEDEHQSTGIFDVVALALVAVQPDVPSQ